MNNNGAPAISLSPPTLLPGLNAPATTTIPGPSNLAVAARRNTPGATPSPAQEFEAVLLTQLLKGMRRTVPQASESSTARDLYHELHDELMASHLARNGGSGIAAIIRAYLDRAPGSTGGGQK